MAVDLFIRMASSSLYLPPCHPARPCPLLPTSYGRPDTDRRTGQTRPLLPASTAAKRTGATPVVLHFHGGAFVSGDLDSGGCIAACWPRRRGGGIGRLPAGACTSLPASGRSRLCRAGVALAAQSSRRRPRCIVAGEEAGGNLAAALALMARDSAVRRWPARSCCRRCSTRASAPCSLRERKARAVGCHWADGWQHYLRLARGGRCILMRRRGARASRRRSAAGPGVDRAKTIRCATRARPMRSGCAKPASR